jgi:uncharacterized membrane protein YeaQ/YmgE (transglycosylase-associated protein family)
VILLFILVWGMFAGWIAHLLLARNQPVNWGELLVVGLAGSFVGGLLISLLSGDGLALRPSGLIGSILGAVVLLAAWQGIRGSHRWGGGGTAPQARANHLASSGTPWGLIPEHVRVAWQATDLW